MEVGDDGVARLAGGELNTSAWRSLPDVAANLAEEPCDNVSEDNSLIGLMVVRRRGYTSQVPQVGLPLVHPANA